MERPPQPQEGDIREMLPPPPPPQGLRARMRVWERVMAPGEAQATRVLRWTPEAQAQWESEQEQEQGSRAPAAPLGRTRWLLIIGGAILVALVLSLAAGCCTSVSGGSQNPSRRRAGNV